MGSAVQSALRVCSASSFFDSFWVEAVAAAVKLIPQCLGKNGRLLEENLDAYEPRIFMLFNKQLKWAMA
jgi:hypothetical protein